MKKLSILCALAAALVFTTCKKTAEDPPAPPVPSCTLTKVTSADGSYYVVTRDGQNRYAMVKFYAPAYQGRAEYEYSGNNIVKLATFDAGGSLIAYNTYEPKSYGTLVHTWVPTGGIFKEVKQWEFTTSGGHITKVVIKQTTGPDFVPVEEDDYTFNSAGNVSQKTVIDLQGGSSSTTNYTYDNKKKPFDGDYGPDPEIQSKNNITQVSGSGGTTNYTYSYNSTNYAITRNTVGNAMSTETYDYTCK